MGAGINDGYCCFAFASQNKFRHSEDKDNSPVIIKTVKDAITNLIFRQVRTYGLRNVLSTFFKGKKKPFVVGFIKF